MSAPIGLTIRFNAKFKHGMALVTSMKKYAVKRLNAAYQSASDGGTDLVLCAPVSDFQQRIKMIARALLPSDDPVSVWIKTVAGQRQYIQIGA